MGDFSNPSKKPRLDETTENYNWDFPGNDDLWGEGELTAEEFDLLEIQATQAVGQADEVLNVNQFGETSANIGIDCETDWTEWERLRQEQYALEGKNKVLTEKLEKTIKELNDERLNREQLIDQKLEEFKIKEATLLREIDKLQTALAFEEHEVRSERTTISMLQHQLKEKTKEVQSRSPNSGCHERPPKRPLVKKTPKILLPYGNSFDFSDKAETVESANQTEVLRCRRFPLSLQAPRGEPKENDILCKLLSCRIVDTLSENSPVCSSKDNSDSISHTFRRARDCSSMSLTMLKCVKESETIWQPYVRVLQIFINCLKRKQSSLSTTGKVPVFLIEDSPPFDLDCKQTGVVTCLRDLTRLLFHQCPQETSINLEDTKTENKNDLQICDNKSVPLSDIDNKVDEEQNDTRHLAELLVMLANPKTYPDGYQITYEKEWALAALVAWSAHSKGSLESCIQDLPLCSIVSGKHGMECAYMVVKLMVQLIGSKRFKEALVHHSGSSCVLCSIGDLCGCIRDGPGNQSSLFMNVIEDFLSGALTCYGFGIIRNESFPCSSKVVQGIVLLLKQILFSKKCNLPCHITALKNGIVLLFFLATHLPNFRANRSPAEESYVTLICGLSKLCKENPEFKKFRSKIRDLWDFQDDASEFESDETRNLQPH